MMKQRLQDIPDNQGDTPLHLAIRNGNIEMVQVLMKYDSDPGLKNNKGRTCFDEAELIKDEGVRKAILEALG